MTWTAAIIVSAKRHRLVIDEVLPAVLLTQPDQTILVSDDVIGNYNDVVSFTVAALTHSTNDALVKRDVAALACTSEWIAYFSDDHKPAPDFGELMRRLDGVYTSKSAPIGRPVDICDIDVWVPARYAGQPGPHHGERLNNGEASEYIPNVDQRIGHYCGGHAGVYRLSLIKRMPWTAGPHHREWDLLQSRRHMDAGAKYCWTDQLKVWDIEPDARPWE